VTETATVEALGTTATVVTDAGALAEAAAILRGELDRIDRACSRFRDDSELSHANARAGEPVHATALFVEAIRVALDAAEATGGLVSPVLGAALRGAGYDRTFEQVRTRGGWTFVRTSVELDAWRSVELDEELRLVTVPRGVELDLGATAKALAADRAAAAIAEATGAGTLVSLGGDIAVAGPVPAGGFAVLVADDHRAPLDAPGAVVAIESGGLASSSVAVRAWVTDSGTAHHLIDPRTGAPADTPWRLVSVAAASCVEANVAATYAVVAGADAFPWLERRGVHARLVRTDGRVLHVGAWPEERAS
jgi:thiamine biosynthesis lipoprotein